MKNNLINMNHWEALTCRDNALINEDNQAFAICVVGIEKATL